MPYHDRNTQLQAMRTLNKKRRDNAKTKGLCPTCGQPKTKASHARALTIMAPQQKKPAANTVHTVNAVNNKTPTKLAPPPTLNGYTECTKCHIKYPTASLVNGKCHNCKN
jgi:hypothetical protein